MATDMMVWNITKDSILGRMAVSPNKAWDVPGTEKGLLPDKSRKGEIRWPELVNQRTDVADANAGRPAEFKKEHGLE